MGVWYTIAHEDSPGGRLRRTRIGIAQINPTVGDLRANTDKILHSMAKAKQRSVDLLTFPELAITGYPPEVLSSKPQFLKQTQESLRQIIEQSSGIAVVVGFVDGPDDSYDAAAVIEDTRLVGVYHKISLANYGELREDRYFRSGSECPIFHIRDIDMSVTIGGDIWLQEEPAMPQAHAKAEVLVNIAATPYHAADGYSTERKLADRAANGTVIVAYNNLVGGQDELVFEGGSLVIDAEGAIVARGKHFEEDLVIAQLGSAALTGHTTPTTSPLPTRLMETPHRIAGVYEALVLGTKDYVRKNGFNKVVIGLSGGIDSSLVATVAVDAMGASNVVGVSMPSRYSSPASKSDAEMLAENLGIKLKVIPIEKAFSSYLEMLADSFINTEPNAAEENIQARIRGNILFALSNKFGWLVLACSNRSETATGYTTLYGDMAGGFIPLKDVPKTMVYELATHRNVQAGKEVIPSSVLSREPSAELRPAHKDTDTLPPYELLDPILRAYVEDHLPIDDIVAMGFHREVVTQVAHLVDSSEYKRRQAAPGIRITPGDYCQGRRLPITNRFRE